MTRRAYHLRAKFGISKNSRCELIPGKLRSCLPHAVNFELTRGQACSRHPSTRFRTNRQRARLITSGPGSSNYLLLYCIFFRNFVSLCCVEVFFFIPIFNQRYFSHIWKCALSYIVRQGFDETLEIRDDDKWLNKYNSFIADIADRSSGKISNSFIVSMDKV